MLDGSITRCIELLRIGDPLAAQVIWDRYFPRLVHVARQQLRGAARRVADEEDVALNAMDRFCRAAQQGRYPDLADRHGLWRLLLRITFRCASDAIRHEKRQRRSGHSGTLADARSRFVEWSSDVEQIADDAPTPEFAALMAEKCRSLLQRLDDPGLQALAIAKLGGATNEEIAAESGCSVRTVERRLRLIRDIWHDQEDES
jgi:DNA-directed RNA polymerase specialized sigma24 family protein